MMGTMIPIVDDETAIRRALERILQQGGYEVVTADDGEQGLRADDLLSRVAAALS